ncbi:hypothetical protein A2U01_0023022, partial [Trifolium medium]|nr:hypothetical protein [Trifolium medium]
MEPNDWGKTSRYASKFHHIVQVVHPKNYAECEFGNVKVLMNWHIYFK